MIDIYNSYRPFKKQLVVPCKEYSFGDALIIFIVNYL